MSDVAHGPHVSWDFSRELLTNGSHCISTSDVFEVDLFFALFTYLYVKLYTYSVSKYSA